MKMEVEKVPLHNDPYKDHFPDLSKGRKSFVHALLTASCALVISIFGLGVAGVWVLIVKLLGSRHSLATYVACAAASLLIFFAVKIVREGRWTYHPVYLDATGLVVLRTDWLTGRSQYTSDGRWSDDLSPATIPRDQFEQIKNMTALGKGQ